ncbi:MAG: alpha/beta hydrolase [Kofleriaceae bacterium]
MSAPGPLPPTRELTFSSGGETLYGEWFTPPQPRGVAIVLHGYAEHCGRYREVAHALTLGGHAALTYDMRGHGRSTGRRGHVERFTDYLDDLDAARALADRLGAELGAPAHRVLVAHSNGSLTALRALVDPDRRPDVAAVVLASPFLALKLPVSPIKRGAARLLSRITPALSMANELRVEDLTHDEGKRAERLADTLCNSVATARWFTEAMAAQALVRERAERIVVPTLWTIAGADVIADPTVSAAVAARVGGAEVHVLDGMSHEVFNELERGRVFDLVTDFIGRH